MLLTPYNLIAVYFLWSQVIGTDTQTLSSFEDAVFTSPNYSYSSLHPSPATHTHTEGNEDRSENFSSHAAQRIAKKETMSDLTLTLKLALFIFHSQETMSQL